MNEGVKIFATKTGYSLRIPQKCLFIGTHATHATHAHTCGPVRISRAPGRTWARTHTPARPHLGAHPHPPAYAYTHTRTPAHTRTRTHTRTHAGAHVNKQTKPETQTISDSFRYFLSTALNAPERGSKWAFLGGPILKRGGPILKSNPPALKSHPPTLKSEQKKAGYFSSPAFHNKSVVMFDNTNIQKVL